MVLPQRILAEESFQLVPPTLAAAATAYQRASAAERAQLALMGEEDLSSEWSDAVRSTVLRARERIREAERARSHLRDEARKLAATLRDAGETSASVLRHTRSVIQLLESTHAIEPDGGRLESELMAWALEDGETR